MRGLLAPLIKLITFLVVTAMATYVLAATIANASSGEHQLLRAVPRRDRSAARRRRPGVRGPGRHRRRASSSITSPAPRPDDRAVRGAGDVLGGQSRPLTTWSLAKLRFRNLVGQRYLALEEGTEIPGISQATLKPKATIPLAQTTRRARPDDAVRRLQAAVPGPEPVRDQRSVDGDHPDLARRRRHGRHAAAADRAADHRHRRQGPGDRRPDRQPVLGARHRRPARCQAGRPDHPAAAAGCPGWPRTARPSATRSPASTT